MNRAIGLSSILPKAVIFALLWWVALQPDSVIAKIYKYKDDNGKVHFTDDASRIPLKYRERGSVKKFRGVYEPTPGVGAPPGPPGQNSAGGSKEDEGLSPKDEGLVKRTIQVFKVGIALSNRYKDVLPNFSMGQGAVNAIQSGLPLKESMASDLAGTKVPELQQALGFLNQSIAVDKQTTSVGAGLKRRIVSIFSRLHDEAKQQTALIKQLEQALIDSKKKKAEAAKKKAEEAKKEFERKKAEAEKKKEEEAQKKEEE
jgi:hypothetical protein